MGEQAMTMEDEIKPKLDEVEGIIARTSTIREKWKGTPGYARNLDIELCALRLLRDFIVETTP